MYSKHPLSYKVTKKDIEKGRFTQFINEITDLPNSSPAHPYELPLVGLSNQQAVVHIKKLNDEQLEEYVPVFCSVDMYIDLPEKRGIHMSRCEEALINLSDKKYDTLQDFALALAREIRGNQPASESSVYVEGEYLRRHKTRVTKKMSKDPITLLANASCDAEGETAEIGLQALHLTACPCTLAYTKFSCTPELVKLGLDIDTINQILDVIRTGTHTQRGVATVLIENSAGKVTHSDLIDIYENSLQLLYDLLKRPDEHDLITRTLKNPQFTEDVVRDLAAEIKARLSKKIEADATIYIESELQDSIHTHDVKAVISTIFAEL